MGDADSRCGVGKSPACSQLMHDDAYVSKSCTLTLMMFRCELGKVIMLVLGFDHFKPNNTEAGMRSLTIIRLVMWEGQVGNCAAFEILTPVLEGFKDGQ